MGRAYTEEERSAIRIRLLEAGLDMFHDQGVRRLSIRELTRRAGIAQGGFYSFFPNKEALVIELIHYRTQQKLALCEKEFDQSLADPAAFVGRAIFAMPLGLKKRAEQKQMYADILHLFLTEDGPNQEKLYAALRATLEKLAAYWQAQGVPVTMDVRGVLNVVKSTLILYANIERLDQDYAQELLKTYIEAACRRYITQKQEGEPDGTGS